jgi:hypothetical protein
MTTHSRNIPSFHLKLYIYCSTAVVPDFGAPGVRIVILY